MSSGQPLLVVTILCVALSVVTADNIDIICSEPHVGDPDLCQKILRSIPGAARLDVVPLCRIAIKNAIVNNTRTHNLNNVLLSKATDPQLKESLHACNRSLIATGRHLLKTQAYFAIGDYPMAGVEAASGGTDTNDCIRAIKSPIPSLLSNVQYVDSYCYTIMVMTEFMPGM